MAKARRRWSKDEIVVRGKRFVDVVSDDLPFRFKIEQGHNEEQRLAGNPFTLHFRGTEIGHFPSVRAAKSAADKHALTLGMVPRG